MAALEGASLSFGRSLPVWSGLSLKLHRGQSVTLLGPSGCGKSTVLRVLAGLQTLTAGFLTTTPQAPAFVFQEPALLPWATVWRNVELPLRVGGMSRAERNHRVREVLQRVGLGDALNLLPHQLSGGMRMRASIARALVMRRDLVLMDEPFSALDDPTRHRLQADLLRWWQSEGFALCFVTHQVPEAVFMSSRVLVMGGRPACIVRQFEVDEPFPREPGFRNTPRFHEICAAISEALLCEDASP